VLNDIRRAASALIAMLGGVTASAANGAIVEIEPGDGPRWGTLSALTAHPTDAKRLFAVTDQDSPPLRIIELEVAPGSVRAVRQIAITAPGFADLDFEGLVIKPDGGFWLASEGQARNSPPNVLLDVDAQGDLLRTVELPNSIADDIQRQGFEGVANGSGDRLYVAFQSGFKGDPEGVTRIAEVNPADGAWAFYHYPLEQLNSGDYSGLSDILHLGRSRFALIERDGKGGRNALKWITTIDLGDLKGAPPGGEPPMLAKRRALDLAPMFLDADRKIEKEIEGLTIAADGQVYAVTDNDNKRPTLLLRLGRSDEIFGALF
jgi:hypothetical protein